jgi:glycosyltransferase involved in cell wall biosynthesis
VYRSISAARNIGLERSRPAQVVLYLDDDVELECDVVREHMSYYDAEPGLSSIAGHVTCARGDREFERLNTFRPEGDFVVAGRGCHMSFRADVLRSVGGFNAYICNNGDETELFRRIRKAGHTIRNGQRAVVKHLVEPTGGNRQMSLRSHGSYARVLRDGMVRMAKDRGFWTSTLWPMKNWSTTWGLMRTAGSWSAGVRSVVREYQLALRLARLSRRRSDYIPLSVDFASGAGIDGKTGLPTV